MMQKTTVMEKLLPSVFNAALVFILVSPVYPFYPKTKIRAILIIVFFFYNLACLFITKSGRDVGMILFRSYWATSYTPIQKVIYCTLYTLSFMSLLYRVYFPFDLLILNLLVIQLPTIIRSGTTFHGLLSGHMGTVHSEG